MKCSYCGKETTDALKDEVLGTVCRSCIEKHKKKTGSGQTYNSFIYTNACDSLDLTGLKDLFLKEIARVVEKYKPTLSPDIMFSGTMVKYRNYATYRGNQANIQIRTIVGYGEPFVVTEVYWHKGDCIKRRMSEAFTDGRRIDGDWVLFK